MIGLQTLLQTWTKGFGRLESVAFANNPLQDVKRFFCSREGWRYQHVQAIIVAIDQYAEAAQGNRDYFLNRPQSIGGGRSDNIP